MVGALLVTLLAAWTPADLVSQISKIEAQSGGRIGVSMRDTGSARGVQHRPNERFLMCSTFKFLAAAAVLKRVDEKKDDLDRFIRYDEKDILQYAPVTKLHLAEGGMKLGDLCAAAIEQSDNTAGNLLLQTTGGPAGVTAFVRTLGDRATRLDRLEPELNISAPGDERDTTTPAAMEHDMMALLTGEVLSSTSRRQLYEWLAKNQTGAAMIRAGVPKGWVVGDKTGRGSKNTNDIAIIRPPGRAPILLAIYVEGTPTSATARDAMIAEVTRVLTEFF